MALLGSLLSPWTLAQETRITRSQPCFLGKFRRILEAVIVSIADLVVWHSLANRWTDNIFRAYRHAVADLEHITGPQRVEQLSEILKDAGLKIGRQKYKYEAAGEVIAEGENVYAVLQGPRADATEAVVLIGAWRNIKGDINYSGVALVLTLARYFKTW